MSDRIPEDAIEEIRTRNDIVDIVGEYVQLTKRGRNHFGLCPFHQERSPSFSVTPDKQIFHCFGCGAGGNVITFLMDIERIPFVEAVARLGARVGIEVQTGGAQSEREALPPAQRELYEAYEFTADYYHHLLINTEEGEPALRYLLDRGVTEEAIKRHKLGWSMPGWSVLTQLLEAKGYRMPAMEEAGLIIRKEQREEWFDRFRSRIMFPVHDAQGRPIAFSARSLEGKKEEPKYMNSPETPLFQKSGILYNDHLARPFIRKEQHAFLMEGFLDVFAAERAGLPQTVATMGTAFTQRQATRLKRIANRVTVCYDGDEAGIQAAKKAADSLQAAGLQVEVALLPSGLDPDEYVRRFGTEDFREKVISATYAYVAFSMYYAKRGKNLQQQNDALQYIADVLDILRSVASPVERDLYLRQLAGETGVGLEALADQLGQIASPKPAPRAPAQRNRAVEDRSLPAPDRRAEQLLLAHMLHDASWIAYAESFADEAGGGLFIREPTKALYDRLCKFYGENPEGGIHRFLEWLEEPDMRQMALRAAAADRDEADPEREIRDCLLHLKRHRVLLSIERAQHELKEAERMAEHRRALELLSEIVALKQSLTALEL